MYIQLYQRPCQLSVVEPHTEEQATQNLGWSWPLGQRPRGVPRTIIYVQETNFSLLKVLCLGSSVSIDDLSLVQPP